MSETAQEFGANLHFGLVEEIDGPNHLVKVYLPDLDMLTPWLPIREDSTQDDKDHSPIDKGAQAAVLLDNRGEEGLVLGFIYSDEDRPPVDSPEKWHKRFKDGTFIEYDRATHVLKVEAQGEITIQATGPITIEGQTITIKSPLIKLQSPALIELDAPAASVNNLIIKGKLVMNPV